MRISFFGSSLVSAYWNGAATYWRGVIHALAKRGHDITFYEPDAYNRQAYRDIDDPDYARVVVYAADVRRVVKSAADAELIINCSGVGVFDDLLEAEVLTLQSDDCAVAFWDVDAPATLDRVDNDADDAFAELIPRYDAIFTYGGGEPVVEAYTARGAKRCVPIYNAVDPTTHHPVPPGRAVRRRPGVHGQPAAGPRIARRRLLFRRRRGRARSVVRPRRQRLARQAGGE